jgi:hypothetical protein
MRAGANLRKSRSRTRRRGSTRPARCPMQRVDAAMAASLRRAVARAHEHAREIPVGVERASSNDEVERRGCARLNEADLSRSSTAPWLTEGATRDRSNRLLDGNITSPLGSHIFSQPWKCRLELPAPDFRWDAPNDIAPPVPRGAAQDRRATTRTSRNAHVDRTPTAS